MTTTTAVKRMMVMKNRDHGDCMQVPMSMMKSIDGSQICWGHRHHIRWIIRPMFHHRGRYPPPPPPLPHNADENDDCENDMPTMDVVKAMTTFLGRMREISIATNEISHHNKHGKIRINLLYNAIQSVQWYYKIYH